MYVYYFTCIYYVYFFKLAKLDSKYVTIGLFCILFLFIFYLICDTSFMYLFIWVDTFIYTMYVYYFGCIYYVYFFKLAKLDSKYVTIGLFCILFLFIVYLICDTTKIFIFIMSNFFYLIMPEISCSKFSIIINLVYYEHLFIFSAYLFTMFVNLFYFMYTFILVYTFIMLMFIF